MFGFNLTEILIFAFVVLLLFGSRIPSTMRSLGLGIHEFRKGLRSDEEAETSAAKP